MSIRRWITMAGLAVSAGLLGVACGDDDNTNQNENTNPLVVPVVTTDTYRTADQMLLANEINESGEPFAEALGYDLDLLDPEVPDTPDETAYVLGIENYEYSRYQLGTVISRSGIGLHMMWAPIIKRMAAMEPAGFDGSMTGTANGVNEDDELMKAIMMFSTQSGHAPPGNPWPEFAEFVSGDPHLPQAVDSNGFAWADFSSLRWDRSLMDKVLNPAAMGQALMKQYLWAQDMLGAFHDADDGGIEPDGVVSPDLPGSPEFDPDNNVFLGGDSLDGFVGQVLTAEGINKVAFITGALAYDGSALGAIDLATYDPANGVQFFPHAVQATEGMVQAGLPPEAQQLTVVDATSHLFDQVSLLWGTSSFTNMMNPDDDSDSAHLAYHHVFDGSPFPPAMSQSGVPGPYDLMKGTSKAIFLNLKAMHYDPDAAVFVDVATLDASVPVRQPDVDTVSSAYLIVALETFIGEFAGTPLEAMARQAVDDQASFLVNHLADAADLYFDHTSVSATEPSGSQSVAAQAAAVRALYVAQRITGDSTYGDAADAAYEALLSTYHVPEQALFRSSPGEDRIVHTPRTVALISGALREATLQGDHPDAAAQYVAFFRRTSRAMQLSEGANTGESGGDSDGDGIPFIPEQPDRLPPIFASQAVYPLDSIAP